MPNRKLDNKRRSCHEKGASPVSECCSSSPVPSHASQKLLVELLYLDRNVCTRCRGAEDALTGALADASPALHAMGFEVEVRSTLVDSEEAARRLQFRSSPTIRIDGHDIQPEIGESSCESCGSLVKSGNVDCREWTWRGERYPSPPKGMIIEALMRAAASPQQTVTEKSYDLPANLYNFFQNRSPTANTCGCGSQPNTGQPA